MINNIEIDDEIVRIKRRIEELETTSKWSNNINTAMEAYEELEYIYNKLKEILVVNWTTDLLNIPEIEFKLPYFKEVIIKENELN